VAIAIRNRWRRAVAARAAQGHHAQKHHHDRAHRRRKTEIARRLPNSSALPSSRSRPPSTRGRLPCRDVESMIRDLTEIGIAMVRQEQRGLVEPGQGTRHRAPVDLLVPTAIPSIRTTRKRRNGTSARARRCGQAGSRRTGRAQRRAQRRTKAVRCRSSPTWHGADGRRFQNMFERIMPKQSQNRQITIREARRVLLEQEAER